MSAMTPAELTGQVRAAYGAAPDPRLRAILDRRYPVYRRLHEALAPHWREAEG